MKLKTVMVSALAGAVVVAIGLGAYAYTLLARFDSAGPLAVPQTVVVDKGAGLSGIARQLVGEGVVHDRLSFSLGVRLFDKAHALKAGEYVVPAGASGREVMDILSVGASLRHHITFAEGLDVREIVALVEGEDKLSGSLTEQPSEGSILPETYDFLRGEGRDEVLDRAVSAQKDLLAALWAERNPELPLKTQEEAVILASIVEKETGVASERARIAGVFYNRLARGMPLQSDPTVIYAITEGMRSLGRALTRKDWELDSPYNTYRYKGLPPAPICNPGRAALEAVFHPEQHGYLYFVADGTGGHAFSKNLKDHNRNVAKLRHR